MKDRLWEAYIQRLCGKRPSRGKYHQLLVVLKTWTPQSPCCAQFLRAFTRHVPPDRWMQWGPEARHSILLELMRIDDGQGQIVPWLAGVIEHEDSPRVLEAIGKWQLEKKMTGDMLWNAWEEWIQDISPVMRQVAWQTLISGQMDEIRDGVPVEPSGNNAIEREIRLAELVLRHLPDESSPEILNILARWKPSLSVPAALRVGLLRQWEEKARALTLSGNDSTSETSSPTAQNLEVKNFELKSAVWQGLTTVASVCPEGDRIVVDIMDAWFSSANASVLSLMSTWRPHDGRLPVPLLLRWSRLLVAGNPSFREPAWRALGKRPGEPEDNPEVDGPGLDPEIWGNCLAGLKLALESDSIATFPWLCMIMQPAGLSLKQRQEWQEHWMKNLSSTVPSGRKGALIHLLRFGDPSLPGSEDLPQRLVKTLTPPLNYGFISHFDETLLFVLKNELSGKLKACRVGEHCLSTEIWRLLLLSDRERYFREGVFQAFVQELKAPGAEENALELLTLWQSVILQETNLSILGLIGSLWHEADGLPEPFRHEMLFFWKKRATDPDPEIRAAAWKVLLPLGDEIGGFLSGRLKDEESPLVLSVMSRWAPSPALALSPRFQPQFWKSWGDVLRRLASNSSHCNETDLGVIGRNLLKLTVGNAFGREFFRHRLGTLKQVSPCFQKEIANWHITLDFLDTLESPPETFSQQPGRMDKSSSDLKIIDLFDRTSGATWTGCSANFRENSFFVAATILQHCITAARQNTFTSFSFNPCINKSLGVMHDLFHHEATHSDGKKARFLPGWNAIRCLLMETTSLHSVDSSFYKLLHLCHGLSAFAQKKAFCQVLGEIRQSPGHLLAPLADLALWREVCVAWEMARPFFVRERVRGIEGEIDVIAGRRWLREWIHTFDVSGDVSGEPDVEVGAGGPVRGPASDEKTSKQNRCPPNLLQSLGSMLWEAAFPDLIPVPRRKQGRNVGNFGLPEAGLVFRPLLGTGEVANGEVVRTTGYPSIHHAGSPVKGNVKDKACER